MYCEGYGPMRAVRCVCVCGWAESGYLHMTLEE